VGSFEYIKIQLELGLLPKRKAVPFEIIYLLEKNWKFLDTGKFMFGIFEVWNFCLLQNS
jgi:hypothetical protein